MGSAPAPIVLDPEIHRIADSLLHGVPAHLRESMLYSLLGPGKRIRPRLVLAVSEAIGLEREAALRLATAIEMVHAYTLVHDDLPAMDNDDFRRGRPTNHKAFGEATAILAGDALALLGIDAVLAIGGAPADRVLAAARILLEAAGARGVIAGQAAESTLRNEDNDSRRLLEVFRLKTGALFRAALSLPVALVPPTDETRRLGDVLSALGDAIGIAFQIADDLEDDFERAKTNPAHIASRFTKDAARELAERTLSAALEPLARAADGSPKARVRAALEPFLSEIRTKLVSTGAP